MTGEAARPEDDPARILEAGRRVLGVQARILGLLREGLGEAFLEAVELLFGIEGRVVVTGMGKSGIISHKIAATLASTGTPALFLHPAEAIHGDLGMITASDVVVAISNSGETEEVVRLIPSLALLKVPLVSVTSRPESTLARVAAVNLHLPMEEEGCPIGLAPMASTTASLALGDALAAALMERRGFQPRDYAIFHPGGSLGRRLLTRVRDLMCPLDECATVKVGTPMREVLDAMISAPLGALLVLEAAGRLAGYLSDGDFKRALRRHESFQGLVIDDLMTRGPLTCEPDLLAERALRIMEERLQGQITTLPVVDDDGRALGMIRLHDIVKAKIK